MFATEILKPLLCDNNELKVHTDNFNHIKLFLASIKPTEEPLTMEDFLLALQLDYDTYILAIRSSLKTATTFIRHSPSEIMVNNYNPACLQAWRANQDIQFILDVYACMHTLVICCQRSSWHERSPVQSL